MNVHYSFKDKVELISILLNNDGNITRTEKETGKTKRTICKWRDEYGYVVKTLIEKHKGDLSKVTNDEYEKLSILPAKTIEKEDAAEVDFKALVTQAKILAIRRLKVIVAVELDTKKVADALKLLVDIEDVDVSESKDRKTVDDYATFLLAGYKDTIKN